MIVETVETQDHGSFRDIPPPHSRRGEVALFFRLYNVSTNGFSPAHSRNFLIIL